MNKTWARIFLLVDLPEILFSDLGSSENTVKLVR